MDVEIEQVGRERKEQVLIRCHAVTEEVREIAAFVKSRQGRLTGMKDSRQYEIAVSDIYYFESVDGKTFLYTKEQVYETAYRIYELESMLRSKNFLRVSKSMLLNLMKIRSIQSALNGRFAAVLLSGEEVIISRNYVKGLKAALRGE
ncbi:MAG: LytTR family transcriptional regulator DNA-binding domain-containing protein [Lachnospiraceae bacterium]|jgi:DNA-binding LytR/AlgR family response regulator|nr:LytTR family transcriptional regulator DNA-binding domain-containing protein [Lachnospiraceae bacterium]MBR3279467.1 LytTR family transcriptional regulator DNA-binding domain-containing protein [Lachnospiraceae bacterium]